MEKLRQDASKMQQVLGERIEFEKSEAQRSLQVLAQEKDVQIENLLKDSMDMQDRLNSTINVENEHRRQICTLTAQNQEFLESIGQVKRDKETELHKVEMEHKHDRDELLAQKMKEA